MRARKFLLGGALFIFAILQLFAAFVCFQTAYGQGVVVQMFEKSSVNLVTISEKMSSGELAVSEAASIILEHATWIDARARSYGSLLDILFELGLAFVFSALIAVMVGFFVIRQFRREKLPR